MGVKSFAVRCSVEEEAGSERKEPHHPFSIPHLQNPQRSWTVAGRRLRPSAPLVALLTFSDRICISDLQMQIHKVMLLLFMFSNSIKRC